ncbi:MAG: hypothetical protein JO364_19510 [Pseudonocardiales bacterium]|nr:hypothetical protein [Pseudonocardiales bacterium]
MRAKVPTITGPVDVVGLAISLEDVATQTYVKDVGVVSTAELRQLFAGVESQHRAILLAVQALLHRLPQARRPDGGMIPP